MSYKISTAKWAKSTSVFVAVVFFLTAIQYEKLSIYQWTRISLKITFSMDWYFSIVAFDNASEKRKGRMILHLFVNYTVNTLFYLQSKLIFLWNFKCSHPKKNTNLFNIQMYYVSEKRINFFFSTFYRQTRCKSTVVVFKSNKVTTTTRRGNQN